MRKKQAIIKNFDFYIDEFMYYCRSKRLRPKTMQSYEQALRLFERWCSEEEKINEPAQVTEQTMRRYICSLEDRGKYTFYAIEDRKDTNCPERRRDFEQPISVVTINSYIRYLKVFFTWYSYNHNRVNPMQNIRQLKMERQAKDFLEDHEIHKLMQIFDKSYFPEHRDSVIIMLLLDSGMRLGECLQIKVEDVDIVERTIMLPAENTKGRKTRCVFFSVKTARALRQWLRYKDRYTNSPLLFPVKAGTPLSVHTFDTNFKHYLARAGISKMVSPHALRNNFAKRCLMNGMDIYTLSRILGHSSVAVTEKAYLDIDDRDLRHRYENFSPIENMQR